LQRRMCSQHGTGYDMHSLAALPSVRGLSSTKSVHTEFNLSIHILSTKSRGKISLSRRGPCYERDQNEPNVWPRDLALIQTLSILMSGDDVSAGSAEHRNGWPPIFVVEVLQVGAYPFSSFVNGHFCVLLRGDVSPWEIRTSVKPGRAEDRPEHDTACSQLERVAESRRSETDNLTDHQTHVRTQWPNFKTRCQTQMHPSFRT
jgi:hypothetical protein